MGQCHFANPCKTSRSVTVQKIKISLDLVPELNLVVPIKPVRKSLNPEMTNPISEDEKPSFSLFSPPKAPSFGIFIFKKF